MPKVKPESLGVTEDDISGPSIDRRTTLKLLSAVGLSGLAGCTGDDPSQSPTDQSPTEGGSGSTEDPTSGTDKHGGRLIAGWDVNQISQLDPHFSTLSQASYAISNLFNGLTRLESDLTLSGGVAEDWTVENGGKRITFELYENVKFHNGDDFTAEDVKYSLNRVRNNDTPHISKLSTLKSDEEDGIVVHDDYTVELNFSEAFAPILVFLTPDVGHAGAIVNQNAIEEMGREQYAITPVGTGPFKIVQHELGSTLSADAFEDYHKTDEDGNQLPYLDGIDLEPIKEPSTRINAMRGNDLDFTLGVPPAQADSLDSTQNITVETVLGPNFGYIAFNHGDDLFESRKARLAVAKSIDKEAYVEQVKFGNAVANPHVYSPAWQWLDRPEDEKPDVQKYDPEGARQLAEEAGISDVEVTLTTAPPELRGAKVIRTMLQETLGWEVEINQMDFPTLFDRVPNGNFQFMPW